MRSPIRPYASWGDSRLLVPKRQAPPWIQSTRGTGPAGADGRNRSRASGRKPSGSATITSGQQRRSPRSRGSGGRKRTGSFGPGGCIVLLCPRFGFAELELVRLPDQVGAEAVVRLLVGEGEAAGEIDAAGRDQ